MLISYFRNVLHVKCLDGLERYFSPYLHNSVWHKLHSLVPIHAQLFLGLQTLALCHRGTQECPLKGTSVWVISLVFWIKPIAIKQHYTPYYLLLHLSTWNSQNNSSIMSVQTIDIVSSSNIYFMHLRFSCPHTFLQLCCARSFDGTGNRHRSYTWVLVQALHLTHFDFYLWIFCSYIVTPSYP